MATTLATPSFVAGARDDLATVDVYTQKSDSVVNKAPVITALPSLAKMDALRGGVSALTKLPGLNLSSIKLPGATVNGFVASLGTKTNPINLGSLTNVSSMLGGGLSGLVKSVTSSAAGAVGGLVSSVAGSINPKIGLALNAVTPAIAQGITSKLSAKVPGLANLAGTSSLAGLISVGGTMLKIPAGNLASANSLLNAVGNINPASIGSTFNPSALSGLASGLVSQGSKLGLSGVFTQLKPVLTTPGSLTDVIRGSLPDVVSSSNLGTLKEFANVKGALPLVSSTLLGDFGSSFKGLLPTTNSEKEAQFGEIKSTFSLIEPDWNKYERMTGTTTGPNGEVVIVKDNSFDLSNVLGGSSEFKTVLTTGAKASTEAEDKPFVLASVVSAPDTKAQFEQQYPQAAAQPANNPAAPPVDPIEAAKPIPDTSSGEWRIYKSTISGSGGNTIKRQVYINGDGNFKIVNTTTRPDGTSSSTTEYSTSPDAPPAPAQPSGAWPMDKCIAILDKEIASYPPAGTWTKMSMETSVDFNNNTTLTGKIESATNGTKFYKCIVNSNGGYMTTWSRT